MKLKYQLVLLGLISLVFPITGWFALKSVDTEFRNSLEQAANSTLLSLQSSIEQILKSNQIINLDGLVLSNLDELTIDGYTNEWQSITAYKYQSTQHHLQAKIALFNKQLALLISTDDETTNINPGNTNNNDYVLIGIVDKKGMHQYKFYRQAEGIVLAQRITQVGPEVSAFWHEKSQGYTLELLFDDETINHLGFVSINKGNSTLGTLERNNSNALKLLPISSNNTIIQNIIDTITPNNHEFTIKDQSNRIIYQSTKLPNSDKAYARQWLLTPIYQWMFGSSPTNSKHWFYRESDGMAGVMVSSKDEGIKYELKSMMPHGQQNMVQILLKSALMMLLVVVLVIAVYLMYSLLLAWRIRNLNKALQSVLDDSGKLTTKMPSHHAKDEIGQLSRGVESMLEDINQYTHYLKDLGSRLSHEMKTPIAIVQTSLDNLQLDGVKSEFLDRSQTGITRLKFILNQLSEVSKLKYTLENTAKDKINLTLLCQQLGESYQSYIAQLSLNITKEDLFIVGSSDLISQMLDKLIENAKDFCPQDGAIKINLYLQDNKIHLSVTNTGPKLPKNKKELFDSLVSIRQRDKSSSHMGIGLYLVKLIVNFHNATVAANNLKNKKEVEFLIIF